MRAAFYIGSRKMSFTSKILTRSTIQVAGAELDIDNSAHLPEIVEMLLAGC